MSVPIVAQHGVLAVQHGLELRDRVCPCSTANSSTVRARRQVLAKPRGVLNR